MQAHENHQDRMKLLDVPQSGSVAGVTSSRNRFGQYRRTRAIPVQPRTPKQTTNRAAFTNGSSAWRALTDVERTAWNDYAAQISYNDSLGSSYSPTGQSLYVASSVSIQAAPPANPPATLPTYSLYVTGMTYTDPSPGPEALTFAIQSTSADSYVLVETSGPVSPGVTSAAAVRRWRSLPTSAANLLPNQFAMSASPVAILTQYKFLFPSPAVGQSIWFRFKEIWYETLGVTPIANHQAQTFRLVIV